MIVRRILLAAFVLVLGVSAAVAWWTRREMTAYVVPRELGRLSEDGRRLAALLESSATTASEDARAIAGLPQSVAVVRGGSPGDRAAARAVLEALFVQQCEAKPWILQMRIIAADESGMEIVRVDRPASDEGVRVVPIDEMQAKGDRPYVAAGRLLADGQAHVSPLEPNVEHGAIVRPFQPVVRAVAPVVFEGRTVAMAVVNVDLGPLLASLQAGLYPGGSVHVVDASGNYITPVGSGREQFAVATGSGRRWQDDYPGLDPAASASLVLDGPGGTRVGAVIVPTSLEPGVCVVEVAPYAQITAIGGAATDAAIAVGAIALVGTLLLVGVFGAWLVRPLNRLSTVVGSYRESSWDLSGLPRNGEFGGVSAAIERMASTVRQRNAQLEAEIGRRAGVEDDLRAQIARQDEAEERFRLVVEASPSGICVVGAGGEILLVNKEMEALLGYRRDELIGQNVDMLVPLAARGDHHNRRDGFMANPASRPMGAGRDLYARRKDGSQVAVEIGLRPLVMNEKPVALASVVDITARRREAARLQEYANRLEASNAELEKFAYVVSHDIKAPLRGIASVATWIAEDFGPVVDAESRENLGLLLERTDRLSRLIDGILAYSRAGREPGERQSVDTACLVADVVASIDPPPHIRVRIEGDFPKVVYNETKLRQVFQNLIDNAVKHLAKPDGEIVVSCERDDREWRFRVRDNGVGIPERHFDRIFELFQTLRPKDETGTTGAGLAIVKRIVESNAGVIRVDSDEGEGTAFTFTVPFVPPKAEILMEAVADRSAAARGANEP
ncbi:MAG: ATP-binding protein [Phycisphaerales bacterium]